MSEDIVRRIVREEIARLWDEMKKRGLQQSAQLGELIKRENVKKGRAEGGVDG